MAGGVAGAAAVGAGVWATLLRDSVDQSLASSSTTTTTLPAATTTTTTVAGAGPVPYGDRVLVVLEMAGGNDALNTLVPAAGLYRDARPHISIPEADLVALAGTDFTLYPALAPLVPYWDEASMAAIVGVGMTPDPVALQGDGHLVVGGTRRRFADRLARALARRHPRR